MVPEAGLYGPVHYPHLLGEDDPVELGHHGVPAELPQVSPLPGRGAVRAPRRHLGEPVRIVPNLVPDGPDPAL